MYYVMVRKEVVETAQQTIAKYRATKKIKNDVIVKNEYDKSRKANVSRHHKKTSMVFILNLS